MLIPPLPATFNAVGEFPILAQHDFFNHAGVAPISARAASALLKYAIEARDHAYLTGRWYRQAENVRTLAAGLLNADPTEIAFTKNTSEGMAFVANGLDWNTGDEIITSNVEYPANIYPWMDVSQRFGVRHIMVPEAAGRIPLDSLFAAITPNTRMIALSHVEYASGFRNDLSAIGEFCRRRNILFTVDAIQSLGVLPVDVQSMHIDFLSADGHKWLLGPEGLGIFYCAKKHLQRNTLRPEIGWMNVVNSQDYGNYDFTLHPHAKRFECGSYNIPGVLALGASLQLITELGPPAIWLRLHTLTSLLADLITEKGYRIFSPRNAEDECSAILSFSSPVHNHGEIIKHLEQQNITIALREGRLRASPHFYNTEEQIRRLAQALPRH